MKRNTENFMIATLQVVVQCHVSTWIIIRQSDPKIIDNQKFVFSVAHWQQFLFYIYIIIIIEFVLRSVAHHLGTRRIGR